MPNNHPKERVYSYYLVALADVLGQQRVFEEHLKNLPRSSPETYPLYQSRLSEAHENSVHLVEQIDDALKTFCNAVRLRTSEMVLPESLSGMNELRLTYQRFSDSFLTYAPFFHLPNMRYLSPSVAAASHVITAYGYLMLISLSTGKPVRGGIDICFATELIDRKVYGPACFQAHKLESRIAQYPRIVIGDELRGFLKSVEQQKVGIPNTEQVDLGAASRIASRCLKMITKDVHGVYMIDYMGEVLQGALPPRIVADLNNRAYTFVRTECSKWEEKSDDELAQKLAPRYRLLLEYFRQSGRLEAG